MSTEICKKILAQEFPTIDAKSWKRVSKRTINGQAVRLFRSKTLGLEVYIGSLPDEDKVTESNYTVLPGGVMCFGIYEGSDGMALSYVAEAFADREDCKSDQHLGEGGLLQPLYNLPDWAVENEACENSFIVYGKSRDDVIKELEALGLKHDPKMDANDNGPVIP